MPWRFEVGQRVTRLSDVFDPESRLMRGKVFLRYSDYENRFGPYPELYMVKWDDGAIGQAYLPHGLDADVVPGEQP